jgi:hypothetical protein
MLTLCGICDIDQLVVGLGHNSVHGEVFLKVCYLYVLIGLNIMTNPYHGLGKTKDRL